MKCIQCKIEKTPEEYSYRYKSRGIRQSLCKICQRERGRKHYQDNKETYYDNDKARKLVVRKEVEAYKESKPCMDCKKYYRSYVMDFDHRDPSEKVAGITVMLKAGNRKKIWAEIAKCDLVCSNCHRERTFGVTQVCGTCL